MRPFAKMCGLGLGLAATGLAQAAPPPDPAEADRRAQALIEAARQAYSPDPPVVRCTRDSADEIVVCLDRPKDQRVPSTAQTDPTSRAARKALDGNVPSAPFVGSIQCRRGPDGVCRGNIGSAPEPAYYLDVTALPAAPEGSDADRISKGDVRAP